jgi:hypothetical protein
MSMTPAAQPRFGRCMPVALVALALSLTAAPSSSFAAPSTAVTHASSLQTAIDVTPGLGQDGELTLSHVLATGSRFVRLDVTWRSVAPAVLPAGFDPSNPDSPGYDWSEVDREVTLAVSRGLAPIIYVLRAPDWAESSPSPYGVLNPDPAQLGMFAQAAARRYDGTRPGLPRVRYWSVWNEPNWSFFLYPQVVGGRDVSVDRYRDMVNAFATAAHGVRADNVVIAGELFPVATVRGSAMSIAPLQFARELFCLSAGTHPRRTCSSKVTADVISVHPYTSGGPSTLPADPNNVWIATLPSLTALVHQAQAQGTLVSSGPVATWVTEFAWNTSPPRGGGVPIALAERWVAETLYFSWRSGVSLFTWFSLRDDPLNVSLFQTGLYYNCPTGPACDRPKPTLMSFRFPFVAYGQGGSKVLVWGRTAPDVPGSVGVQLRRKGRWVTLVTLRTRGSGIFTAQLRLPRGVDPHNAVLRARGADRVTLSSPFSLKRPRDILVKPFV